MIIKPFVKSNINVVNIKNHTPTDYDFYIARPSILGNPYTHLTNTTLAEFTVCNREVAIKSYEKYFYEKLHSGDKDFIKVINDMVEIYNEYGKLNLCCFCKPKTCHGDYIKSYLEKFLSDRI